MSLRASRESRVDEEALILYPLTYHPYPDSDSTRLSSRSVACPSCCSTVCYIGRSPSLSACTSHLTNSDTPNSLYHNEKLCYRAELR